MIFYLYLHKCHIVDNRFQTHDKDVLRALATTSAVITVSHGWPIINLCLQDDMCVHMIAPPIVADRSHAIRLVNGPGYLEIFLVCAPAYQKFAIVSDRMSTGTDNVFTECNTQRPLEWGT